MGLFRDRTMRGRMILVSLLVGLLLTALPALADPPEGFKETNGSGGVEDSTTLPPEDSPVIALFEFGTNGDDLGLNLRWFFGRSEGDPNFPDALICEYRLETGRDPELSFVDNDSSIVITVNGTPNNPDCDDAIVYAELEIIYDNEFFDTERSKWEEDGVECKSSHHFNDNNATARALITTEDHGVILNATGMIGSATYHRVKEQCHDTNAHGKP